MIDLLFTLARLARRYFSARDLLRQAHLQAQARRVRRRCSDASPPVPPCCRAEMDTYLYTYRRN